MMNALGSMNIYQVLLLVLVLLQAMTCNVKSSRRCIASSCGDIRNISYPFRLKVDPKGCGESYYELACEDNRPIVYVVDGQYHVQSIDYIAQQIRLVDDGLQKDNCSSLPRHSWSIYDFDKLSIFNNPYGMEKNSTIVIVNCSKPINSPFYITTSPCITGSHSSNTSPHWNSYALVNPKASDVRDFCTISSWTWASYDFGGGQVNDSSFNFEQIHNIMADGFALDFFFIGVERTFFCYFDFYKYFHFYKYFNSLRFSISSYGGQLCGSKAYFGANDFFDQTTLSTALPPWPDLTPANANGPTESAPSKHEATGVGFHHFDQPAAILASMLLIAPRRRRRIKEEGTVEAPYSLCRMDSLDRCTCRVGLRTRLSSFTMLRRLSLGRLSS